MSDSASGPTVVTLSQDDAGERIDRVLARLCPQFSRSALQRWIEQGRVEQAGEGVSRKTKAQAGAGVSIHPMCFSRTTTSSCSTNPRAWWSTPRPVIPTGRSSTRCSTTRKFKGAPIR